MSSSGDLELFRADVCDCHDRVALLRAKLYRWGVGPNARLQELERDLEYAEKRLRDATARHSSGGLAGPYAIRRR
jgi:hypothetical protein